MATVGQGELGVEGLSCVIAGTATSSLHSFDLRDLDTSHSDGTLTLTVTKGGIKITDGFLSMKK